MGNLFEQFKTNESFETTGVVLDYGDGGRIRIARAGGANKKYLRATEKLSRQYRNQIRMGTFSGDLANKVMQEVFADTVVLGWEGVTDADGTNIPFSRENCMRLFRDLPALWDDVQEQAASVAIFREAELDEVAGN
ncbi:MAG: hypothetical protein L0312_05375 [Acidobacteria bacterium]|nr:hypothetical protein [Acidobacteriota bacterium]